MLVFIVLTLSGCVFSQPTEAEIVGWDASEYYQYATVYYYLNDGGFPCEYNQSEICLENTQTLMFKLEELMMEMPLDTEFEQTWHSVFYYYYKGIGAEAIANEYSKASSDYRQASNDYSAISSDLSSQKIYSWEIETRQEEVFERVRGNAEYRARSMSGKAGYMATDASTSASDWNTQAKQYYNKSYQYRLKIEEWNPSKDSHTPEITPTPLPTPSSTPVSSTPTPTPTPEQKTFTNSIGMEFIEIPVGEFSMGKRPDNPNLPNDYKHNADGPPHIVNISKPFFTSKFEITQYQWHEIMENNPSHFKGDNLPVENVSWTDIQDFIQKLNEKEETDKYRLPSEAEWEWATFGVTELDTYAWYVENSNEKTHPIGKKKPTAKGLYDTSGNVWEWVQDSWHKSYYGAPTDGSVWEGNTSVKVIRGCSWTSTDKHCQIKKRGYMNMETRTNSIGFRLVKEI